MIEKLKPSEGGGFEDETGCRWDSPADYLFVSVLPSCGRGNPADIGRYVLDCLKKWCNTGTYKADYDRDINHGEPPAYEDLPAMFFLNWATKEDFIEHGSTVRCSWTTPLGEELIRDLEIVLADSTAPSVPR